MRVLIVGAGIGGLTAAIALRRKGLEVEVYERAAELTDVGAGISLWPNALKALYQLGMQPALEALSFVSAEGALRTSRGAVLSRTTAREFVTRLGLPVMVFHRAELLTVLVAAAHDVPIHRGHECHLVEQDAARVTARFANGGQASGDVLVGADGLRSIVRQQVAVPGELRYSGYTAWRGIASVDTTALAAGESIGCGQRFGLAPIAGGRVYWYATANRPEGQRDPPGRTKVTLGAMFASWHSPIPSVIAATDEGAILRNDIYDRDPAGRWGSGRITLLGDAAHPMTPNLGQGACQAIEDGLVLARALGRGEDAEPSLRRYEAERMPRTRFVVTASRRVGQMFQMESPALCRVRDVMMRLMPPALTYRSLTRLAAYSNHLDASATRDPRSAAGDPGFE
jgi:2-polyprenyl-6-methoxyphenol hydroxylase-like FAD-dependent oxidoreductase